MDFLDLLGLRKKKQDLPLESDYTTASFINAVPRVAQSGGSIGARQTTPREFSFVDPNGAGRYAAEGNAPQVIPPWLTGSLASVFLNSGSPANSGNYYGASFVDFVNQITGNVGGGTTPTPPTGNGGAGAGAGGSGSNQTNNNPPPAVTPIYGSSPPPPPAPPPVQGGVVIGGGGVGGVPSGGGASTFQTIYGGSSNAGAN